MNACDKSNQECEIQTLLRYGKHLLRVVIVCGRENKQLLTENTLVQTITAEVIFIKESVAKFPSVNVNILLWSHVKVK